MIISHSAGGAFFNCWFPELDNKIDTINEMTDAFNSISEEILTKADETQEDKQQKAKQEDFNRKKAQGFKDFTNRFKSDDVEFLIIFNPVNQYCEDRGIFNLDIDEMFLAYYQLLIKG